MSKVLVDRELLENCLDAAKDAYAATLLKDLQSILAQPAEAEGVEVVAWLHRQGNHTEAADRPLTDEEEARGWEQDELMTVTNHLDALSAVTAERDRLLQEKGDPAGSFEKCMQAMRDRDEHAKTIDQLRAEVEALRKDAERYRWASSGVHEAETLVSIVNCHGGYAEKVAERVDVYREAAMSAKEA